MKKLTLFIFLAALCFSNKLSAQSYDVPRDYHFDKETDYTRYEPEIVKTTDWLQHTHWGAEPKKAEAATQFILKWAQGTPYITIELKQAIMDISDANPQLGFIYMAQYCKYAIQHPRNFDSTKASVEALKAVITKYQSEPAHKKDREVERLIEIDKSNGLEDWVINEFSFQ